MIYNAIVSARIFINEDGEIELEVLERQDNEKEPCGVYDDLDYALLEAIDTKGSKDYFFRAVVTSKFVNSGVMGDTDYEVEHNIVEVRKLRARESANKGVK